MRPGALYLGRGEDTPQPNPPVKAAGRFQRRARHARGEEEHDIL
jgi:hypothetical protein